MQRLFQFILLFTSFCLLILTVNAVKGATEIIGVRIQGEVSEYLAFTQKTGNVSIDYGTFRWVSMPKQELAQLDSQDVEYQVIENPYMLTLGGQSFDPLLQTPVFASAWGEKPLSSNPELHLIQFQGPTKSEWLESLSTMGLEVLQYIHPFTYVVWGEPSALATSAVDPNVRWTGDYLPAYAVLPENRTLNAEPIFFRMMVYPIAEKFAINSINTLGGDLITASQGIDPTFTLLTFQMPGDQIQSLASTPGVYTIQPIPTNGGDRGEMNNQVNAGNIDGSNRAFTGYHNWLTTLGLSGEGVIIANVDSGIDQNHPDLVNRMLSCTGSTCGAGTLSNHGTHTAALMVGDGSSGTIDPYGFLRGLGMAPSANLIEQVYRFQPSDPYFAMDLLIRESYLNHALISGNSWGPSATPLGYDMDTRLVDMGVRDADPENPGNQQINYILSIMNGNGGTSTQGTPDEAKNAFTIGSTYMQTDAGVQYLKINDLSSNTAHGPALDGRIIPHLVAPGCYVDSATSDSSHNLMCGTSMASPQVSGAAALFIEHYRNLFGLDPSPALVKAAFLPVAHNLAGFHDADGDILGHPFNAKQGWGRLNVTPVLAPASYIYYYDQETIINNTGESLSYELSISEPLEELRAMLVWTDAPGHGLGGTTPAWVNDLDFSLSFNGLTYFGNNFGSDGFSISGGTSDNMNNTEGIFMHNLEPGNYTFSVTGANISGDGVPNFGDNTDQDFAIVLYLMPDSQIFNYFLPIVLQ
jgi:subtilisin family serine protease